MQKIRKNWWATSDILDCNWTNEWMDKQTERQLDKQSQIHIGPRQEWLTRAEWLDILQYMKHSIQSTKPDSLSCSNSFCLASRASPDNSKRQKCMASIWCQQTNLFWVGKAREWCFHFSPRRRRLWFTNPQLTCESSLVGLRIVLVSW